MSCARQEKTLNNPSLPDVGCHVGISGRRLEPSQFAYATQEEENKTVIEFAEGLVSSIEETEDHKGGNVRIIVPPLRFAW